MIVHIIKLEIIIIVVGFGPQRDPGGVWGGEDTTQLATLLAGSLPPCCLPTALALALTLALALATLLPLSCLPAESCRACRLSEQL